LKSLFSLSETKAALLKSTTGMDPAPCSLKAADLSHGGLPAMNALAQVLLQF
jgi:hypothetical protein